MSAADSSINDSAPNALFVVDASNYSVPSYNELTGMGGNDTFYLFGGFNNSAFVVTSGRGNTFDIVTGNGTNTYSLVSGASSSFNILQDNPGNDSGVLTFAITCGVDSHVNATVNQVFANYTFARLPGTYNTAAGCVPALCSIDATEPSIGLTFYSIIVGSGSTVDLGSVLGGNETVVNIAF